MWLVKNVNTPLNYGAHILIFFLSTFFLAFMPLMDRLVEIDRKQEAERGGMTCRITPHILIFVNYYHMVTFL